MIAHGIPPALVLLLVSVSLAACGGSSRPATAPAAAHAVVTSAPTPARASAPVSKPAPARSRAHAAATSPTQARRSPVLAEFVSCLRRNGVALPHANTSAPLRGANARAPGYNHALSHCEASLNTTGRSVSRPAGAPAVSHVAPARPAQVSPAITATLRRFTACMRTHGVPAFPEPSGASFNLTAAHLNPNTTAYKSAEAACRQTLQALDPAGG
jgi:hypothetical protein